MAIYMLTMVTTPIFINTVVVFVRLYYFEKQFQGIRKRSKLQSKYRRTLSRSVTLANGYEPRRSFFQRMFSRNSISRYATDASALSNANSVRNRTPNPENDLEAGEMESIHSSSSSPSDSDSPTPPMQPRPIQERSISFQDPFMHKKQNNNSPYRHRAPSPLQLDSVANSSNIDGSTLLATPSTATSKFSQKRSSLISPTEVEDFGEDKKESDDGKTAKPSSQRDIKFADLPHPSRNHHPRHGSIKPADIARSITLLQNRQRDVAEDDDNEGPALVIRGFRDVEDEDEEAQVNGDNPTHKKGKSEANRYIDDTLEPEKEEDITSQKIPFSEKATHELDRDATKIDNSEESDESYASLKRTITSIPMTETKKGFKEGLGNAAEAADEENICNNDNSNNTNKHGRFGEFKARIKQRAKSFDHGARIPRSLTFEKVLSKSRRKNNNIEEEEAHSTSMGIRNTGFERALTAADNDFESSERSGLALRNMSSNFVSGNPIVEGNSVFVDLTDEQKDELGGVEYRALKLLAKILVSYYVGWHVFAVVILTPWIVTSKHYGAYIERIGVNRAWWGIFTANSSLNNLGLTLTPDSMVSFVESLYVLIFVPIFMIVGNTGFPIMLRFIIWIMHKVTNPYGRMNESLGFLLEHPRRCFTLLFPSGPTWWLLGVVVLLNLIDTVLFLVLDLSRSAVTMIPIGYRILAGFFEAVSTRTTGFSIFDLMSLHSAVIVSYTVMMYINIFPVAMSVRHTNVYEEQTLGLYRAPTVNEGVPARKISGVATHLMRQLSYDLWFMFIALFIVCITEEGKITNESNGIPIFNILFEVTSAYGTVGLSMGYPGTSMSLSAQFSVIGKLVIIILLYRGRHRALPYAIDRAIILPSKKLEQNDLAQERTLRRFNSITDDRSHISRPRTHSFINRAFTRSSQTSFSPHHPPPRNFEEIQENLAGHRNIHPTFSTGSRRAPEDNNLSLRTFH